jgi:hypothetical protein
VSRRQFDDDTAAIIGKRVSVCPSTNYFMMGARFGVVLGLARTRAGAVVAVVKLDRLPRRLVRLPLDRFEVLP